MSEATLGSITSVPDSQGRHSLKCPECFVSFLSVITQDYTAKEVSDSICPNCHYTAEPKVFIAVAHQQEVNDLAMAYIQKELKKSFGRRFK